VTATHVVAAHIVTAQCEPTTSEAPPNDWAPAVKGVASVKWVARKGMFGAYRALTAKGTRVIAKAANVTTKAANVASKPAAVSGCQRRWSQRQAQCKRHRRRGIT
jgi:hypothetical protein